MLVKSLRYSLFASGLALTTAIALAPAAFAADTGDGEIISDPYATIAYTKETTLPSVNLLTESFADKTLKIGSVLVKANGATGFDVKVTSTNAGVLKNGAGGTGLDITYKLQYASQTAVGSISASTPTQLATEDFSTGCASAAGCSRDISVFIPGTQWATNGVQAGNYKTSLTFSIANK